jgi:hypothetical protein
MRLHWLAAALAPLALPDRMLAGAGAGAGDPAPALSGWQDTIGFSTSLARLQEAITNACRNHGEWPARVAAGIRATIMFAIANPDAVRSLAIEPQLSDSSSHQRYLIEHFSAMFAAEALSPQRLAGSSDEAVVAVIAAVIGEHLRHDRLDQLGEMASELVYLSLLPYLGFDEAKSWAESAP